VASVEHFPSKPKAAVGSMNHLAFHMAENEPQAALGRLEAAGVPFTPAVVNHDDSPAGVARENHEGVFEVGAPEGFSARDFLDTGRRTEKSIILAIWAQVA
jgi:hypothetical protein